ncbi:MAG: hypothetical protein KAU03_01040, partial [Candidatus Altiarchaeales archaeon]|nr:hypothetical protein [Candidatus Altiarchaeales archaeon]
MKKTFIFAGLLLFLITGCLNHLPDQNGGDTDTNSDIEIAPGCAGKGGITGCLGKSGIRDVKV